MKTAPYNIGDVCLFYRSVPDTRPNVPNWAFKGARPRDACLIGDERIAALRAAYRREPMPNDLILYVYGVGPISADDVHWDSAGERVTG